jgi:hypothetical protein
MTRPWAEIREHYGDERLVDKSATAGMLKLVTAIMDSRYADGLHAWTSILDLCIVQTPMSYPYNGPYLRVSPRAHGKLEFRYIDTWKEDQQWHRVVAQEDGFKRLEGFLEQLHWFTKTRRPDA